VERLCEAQRYTSARPFGEPRPAPLPRCGQSEGARIPTRISMAGECARLIGIAVWTRLRRQNPGQIRSEGSTMKDPVNPPARRRIIWVHVLTVLSAAILIGAEVFGAAFAGGWALAGLFHLGETGGNVLRANFLHIVL